MTKNLLHIALAFCCFLTALLILLDITVWHSLSYIPEWFLTCIAILNLAGGYTWLYRLNKTIKEPTMEQVIEEWLSSNPNKEDK